MLNKVKKLVMATLSELITARDDTPPPPPQQGTPHHPGSGFQGGVIPSHLMRSSQGSPGVDRMPQLKQLVLSADEDVTASHQTQPSSMVRCFLFFCP
uniref:Uncharacterized protein n=1 Tax=Ascaris lumbricoides TaxID=6252 RepID=A0A0M3HLQ9_ASCLU